MSYLISQLWMCLLVAGLVGLLLGWLLSRLLAGGKFTAMEDMWRFRLSGLEGERDRLQASLMSLTANEKKLQTDLTACGAKSEFRRRQAAFDMYKSGFDPTVNVRLRHSFNGRHYRRGGLDVVKDAQHRLCRRERSSRP